jgi:CRP-like cAMP-binding protein
MQSFYDFFRRSMAKFVCFSDEEWALFCSFLSFQQLEKKEQFATEGKVCSKVGFVVSGAARFYFVKNGVEISNYFSFEGDFISSYKSFLTKEPSAITVEALEPLQLLCYTAEGMQQMLAHDKLAYKMERFGRLIGEYLICCYEDRLMSFISQTPEERYCNLLQSGYDIVQRIPQHYIANYLGITPVSLSRIRKRLLTARVK